MINGPKFVELTADVLKICVLNILRVRTIAFMLSEAVLAYIDKQY